MGLIVNKCKNVSSYGVTQARHHHLKKGDRMENEEWKQIIIDNVTYNYEVSTHGRVRHIKTKQHKKLFEHRGYLKVVLWYGHNKQKNFSVHRLVATMFIPNPQNLTDVDHIDRNRHNNHVSNLRWLSHKNNIHHKEFRKVRCIETGEIFDNIQQASEKLGIIHQNISRVCNGKRKSTHGLHFEYVD